MEGAESLEGREDKSLGTALDPVKSCGEESEHFRRYLTESGGGA